MIRLKFDVVKELNNRGYTPSKIKYEHILGESSMSALRKGTIPREPVLNTLCKLLNMQVGDILEYVPDEEVTK